MHNSLFILLHWLTAIALHYCALALIAAIELVVTSVTLPLCSQHQQWGHSNPGHMSTSKLCTIHWSRCISHCCPVQNKWGQPKRECMYLLAHVNRSRSSPENDALEETRLAICEKRSFDWLPEIFQGDLVSCEEGATCFLASLRTIRFQKNQSLFS